MANRQQPTPLERSRDAVAAAREQRIEALTVRMERIITDAVSRIRASATPERLAVVRAGVTAKVNAHA